MRSVPITTVTGSGGNGSGLSLGPVSHATLQTAHGGLNTEPVTPPSPQVSHSNLSQVARAHPYAAALPSAPLPPSSSGLSGRYAGQSSMPSSGIYANSAPYSSRANENLAFPLRSPPDRSCEVRRRLTLLPHTGVPMDYGGGPPGLGGGGSSTAGGSSSSGSRHPISSLASYSQMGYSTVGQPTDGYREPLIPSTLSSGESTHKKLRISGGEPLMKATIAQPLRIDTRPIMTAAASSGPLTTSTNRDTRDQPAYIPQVEAISPTPDSPSRSTKDELLQQITKVYTSSICIRHFIQLSFSYRWIAK